MQSKVVSKLLLYPGVKIRLYYHIEGEDVVHYRTLH